MIVHVEYTQVKGVPCTKEFFEEIMKKTLHLAPFPSLQKKKEVTVSVVSVTPEYIQELNKQYREMDKTTDILSFGEYATKQDVRDDAQDSIFLGELFLNYEYIRKSAIEDKVSVEREMTYVFSHGILHLLGYDHEDEMFRIQDEVTSILSLS